MDLITPIRTPPGVDEFGAGQIHVVASSVAVHARGVPPVAAAVARGCAVGAAREY